MTSASPGSPDLLGIARTAMLASNFLPDFSPAARAEAASAARTTPAEDAPAPADLRDLRALLWSSIDNRESLDLDQIEYVEQLPDDSLRLMVGIADVDAYVPRGSATDEHAAANTVSVYAGVVNFPMLPEEYSTGITSLLEGSGKKAIVVDLVIDAGGGLKSVNVYPALTRNFAKLAYGSAGDWLEGRGPIPEPVARTAGMEQQLRLQVKLSERLGRMHAEAGALRLDTAEASPLLHEGQIVDLVVKAPNTARDLIENFMIAANTAVGRFLDEKVAVSLRRVVRTPKRWDRIVEIAAALGETLPSTPDAKALAGFLTRRESADPTHFQDLSLAVVKLLGPGEYIAEARGSQDPGHFGLAVVDYTHSTAPNRRFSDLVTQRLIKRALAGEPPPYTAQELSDIAAHCNERESAARKVERTMRKAIAAKLLTPRIGESFDAIVTGVSPKGTFVRLLKPPAEGRVVRGATGLDVGDKTRVRLVGTDVARGFIDFEGSPSSH